MHGFCLFSSSGFLGFAVEMGGGLRGELVGLIVDSQVMDGGIDGSIPVLVAGQLDVCKLLEEEC